MGDRDLSYLPIVISFCNPVYRSFVGYLSNGDRSGSRQRLSEGVTRVGRVMRIWERIDFFFLFGKRLTTIFNYLIVNNTII